MVNLIEAMRLGLPTDMLYEEDGVGDDGIPNLKQVPALPFEWLYSVNIFASDPVDRARQVVTWSVSDAAALRLYPLMIMPVGRIRRLPIEIDGKWEGRAQFDLAVRGYVKRGVITDGDGAEIEIGRVPVDEILEGTVTLGPRDHPDLVSGEYHKPEGD